MKPKNKNTKRKTASKVSTSGSERSDQKLSTCYEYFKVKKSPVLSVDSKELTANDVQETSSSSVIANKSKNSDLTPVRPRRLRQDSLKQSPGKHQASSGLSIEDVQMLVEAQDSYEGGVNCPVCGKLYKSKVCFIKHIWEHTTYWDVFDNAKNHEKVLSIQAAIILCGMSSQTNGSFASDLCNLLVTSPHSSELKQERDNEVTPNNELNNSFLFLLSEKCAEKSPLVVECGKDKSNSAVGNLLHTGAAVHRQVMTTNNHSANLASYIQMLSTSTGEYWRQPSSVVGYARSEMSPSPTSQTHSILTSVPPKWQTCSPVFYPQMRPYSYAAELSSTQKPNFYLAQISPRQHFNPAEKSAPIPHSYTSEILARPHSYTAEILTRPHSNIAEILTRPHSNTAEILTRPHYNAAEISATGAHSNAAKILTRHHSNAAEILTRPHSNAAEILTRPHFNAAEISATGAHSNAAKISATRPYSYAAEISAAKPQTNSAIFPQPVTPQYFPRMSFPPPQQHIFQVFSSPLQRPVGYPASESGPMLMLATSSPTPQISVDASQEYKSPRHPSDNPFDTLESKKVTFVSPLKRKRED